MPPTPSDSWLLLRIEAVPAWARLGVALLLGGLVYLLLPAQWHLPARITAAWDAFSLATLLFTWPVILLADVDRIRRTANREDPGRTLTFMFVIVAAVASLLAVVLLLSSLKDAASGTKLLHVVLALLAVVASWLLVHTVFTLRYAHLYYDGDVGSEAGGLDFPGGEQQLNYLDFAYYSFTIGMTAQTSDVEISSRPMRLLTLLHSVLSFGFNTAVVALSINGLAGLL